MSEVEELRKLVKEARQWVPKMMGYWHLRAADAVSGDLRNALVGTRVETATGDFIRLPPAAIDEIVRNIQRAL